MKRLVLVALVAALLTGCSGKGHVDMAAVRTMSHCRRCTITGQVDFDHPSWGRSHLFTFAPATRPDDGAEAIVVDDHGRLRWRYAVGGAGAYDLRPVHHPVDARGWIYLTWNPGRYDGVSVLRPTRAGFVDDHTLPVHGDHETRFYDADVRDPGHGGRYEIELLSAACHPSCTDAEGSPTVFRFTDGDWRAVVPTKPQGCGSDWLFSHDAHQWVPGDAVQSIRATGVICPDAFDVVQAVGRTVPYPADRTDVTVSGFACTIADEHYRCTKGRATITFRRSPVPH